MLFRSERTHIHRKLSIYNFNYNANADDDLYPSHNNSPEVSASIELHMGGEEKNNHNNNNNNNSNNSNSNKMEYYLILPIIIIKFQILFLSTKENIPRSMENIHHIRKNVLYKDIAEFLILVMIVEQIVQIVKKIKKIKIV